MVIGRRSRGRRWQRVAKAGGGGVECSGCVAACEAVETRLPRLPARPRCRPVLPPAIVHARSLSFLRLEQAEMKMGVQL